MSTVIVDYRMGNVGSIANMLKRVGAPAVVSGDPDDIVGAERLILPGVGAFDMAMEHLADAGLVEPLDRAREAGVPILGICLGMQLLASASEEGVRPGLGWIPGQVRRLPSEGPEGPLRIPHMGWSEVEPAKVSAHIPALGTSESRYYFVHSYAFVPDDPDDVLGRASWGHRFVAAVEHENVVGVQFHPEKSHRHGMALLAGFAGL